MSLYYTLGIIIIIGAVVFAFKEKLESLFSEEQQYPFKKKDYLLNIPERQFFDEIKKIVPATHIVFPQIQLSAILKVDAARNKFWTYQNKINRKTVDFVIFELPYYKPILGIEYDGRTHEREDRVTRDNNVNEMLKAAGIKSLHVKHEASINYVELKTKIAELLTNAVIA